jgi:hypothetical protein
MTEAAQFFSSDKEFRREQINFAEEFFSLYKANSDIFKNNPSNFTP